MARLGAAPDEPGAPLARAPRPLTACAPALQGEASSGRPSLAVVNGPSELRERGLAERFVGFLQGEPEAQGLGFASPSALRYQERYRDLTGSRAPLQTAFIARSQGAELGLLVGFRAVLSVADLRYRDGVMTVRFGLAGAVEATLVDAASAEVRGEFRSSPQLLYVVRRIELELPEGLRPDSPEGRAYLERRARELGQDLEVDARERLFDDALLELSSPVAQTVGSILGAR